MTAARTINFKLKGMPVTADVKPHHNVVEVLQSQFSLTGARETCGQGLCGCCTVVVNGRAVSGCLYLATFLDGTEVTTVEGLDTPQKLHPVQEAFLAHDGLQCGFCTPGQIMSAIGLIQEAQAGDEPERVREGMSGNLCRCGAYRGITEAVLEAQKVLDAAGRREVA